MKALSQKIYFIFKFITSMAHIYIPLYLLKEGLLGSQIGFLMGLVSLTGLIITLPIGVSNDLLNPKKLMMLSFAILGLVFFSLGLSAIFYVLIIVFVFFGVGANLADSSIRAHVFKTLGNSHRGKWFSGLAFYEHAGAATGIAIGGILLISINFEWLFMVAGAGFLASIPIMARLESVRTTVFDAVKYKKELLRKEVMLFATIAFLFAYHWGTESTTYSIFLKTELLFSEFQIGLFIGVTVWMLALSAIFFGKVLDSGKYSMKKIILIGLIASALGHILLAFSQNGVQAFIFRSIHEIGDAAYMVFFYVTISRLFKQSKIGGGAGFITQIVLIAFFIGALISGFLMQYYGPRIPMVIAGVLSLAAIFIVRLSQTS